MDFVNMKAYGKINLTLDVINKRDDGYYNLQMIMQTVKLYDRIFIELTDKYDLKLVTDLSWLPTDENNLVFRAAKQMKIDFGINKGLFIKLKKNIPVAAGMAGGSSDCAATLVGIRNLLHLPLSDDELIKYARQFGADVPYCVMRGTVLAEGIGDELTKLNQHTNVHILIAKPPVSISTPLVFKGFSQSLVKERPNTKKMISAIQQNDLNLISKNFCNVLESVTIPMCPTILDIKNSMISNGALNSLMSGSGPTVFGYFNTYSELFVAKRNLQLEFPKIKEIYATSIFNPNTYFGKKVNRKGNDFD